MKFKEKLKGLFKVKKLISIVLMGGLVGGGYFYLSKKAHQKEKDQQGDIKTTDAAHKHPKKKSFAELMVKNIKGVQHKADELKRADEENIRLKLENVNLRHWAEAIRFDCASAQGRSKTNEFELTLTNETGTRVGRTLASIDYRPPTHLLPGQLFTLGVSYLKAKEYEKSAVIFSFLTGLEEYPRFQNAENFLMTGVTWYKVDHLKLADSYFERALQFDPSKKEKKSDSHQQGEPNSSTESMSESDEKIRAQARLWRALVAKRLKKHGNSQKLLRSLVGHHPHSMEAAWVNSPATRRLSSPSVARKKSNKQAENKAGAEKEPKK